MSQENVEIVREMYEAFNRADFKRATELLHPDAEMHQAAEVPDTGSYYGRDEFARGLVRWTEEWEELRFELESVSALSDGRVFMEVALRGRGKQSGAETAWADLFHIWTMQDGKGRRLEVYASREKALEAAGLRE